MITNACVRCGGSAYEEDGETICLNCGATLDPIPASILDTVKIQRAIEGRGRRRGTPTFSDPDGVVRHMKL